MSNALENANTPSPRGVEFESTVPTARRATWLLIGAAVGGVFWLLMVMLLFLAPKASSMMPGMLGGLAVLWVMPLLAGLALLRTPQRVRVDERGMTIHGAMSAKRVEWGQVASVERRKADGYLNMSGSTAKERLTSKDVLVLKDAKGKKIAELASTLERFAELAALVEQFSSAAQGRPTYDAATTIARKKRQARLVTYGFGTMALLLGIGLCLMTSHQSEEYRKYHNDGREVLADVIQVKPFMGNYKVTYEFNDGTGRVYRRDGVCTQRSLDAIDDQNQVMVRYVPSDPEFNRLAKNDLAEPDKDLPDALAYAAGGMFALFGVVLIATGILGFADLKITDGKVKLVRIGDLSDDLAPERLPETGSPAAQTVFAFIADRPVARRRPAGLTVIAILNIVFGAGVILINLVRTAGAAWLLTRPDPVQVGQFEVQSGGWTVLLLIVSGAAVVMGVLSAVSGGLLLGMRRSGRMLGIVASGGLVVLGLGKLVMGMTDLLAAPTALDTSAGHSMAIGLVIGLIMAGVGTVYSLAALVLLSRPSTGEALATAGQA